MRNKLTKIALAATFGIALALTFSCSSGDDGDGSGGTYSPNGGSDPSTLPSCTDGTIKIGTQTWHKCNLNVVPSKGNHACYANNPENCDKYGRLYDWEAAKSACPSGFHLPTNEEWGILVNHAGGEDYASEKLKATRGWAVNGNGTDDYGFSALPGGYGTTDGFGNLRLKGYWWSATESNASQAYRRYMEYNDINVPSNDGNNDKTHLYSVRCIKD